jgi:peptidoglycan hydrolase-like protein with peptidoglycan-binding domain
MATQAAVLREHAIQNPEALVAAAAVLGVPLWIAAAVAQKESGGRNIYGNDVGGVFSTPSAPDLAVTQTNYETFYRRVVELGEKSNGVGPMQITYRAYHPDARNRGFKLWRPFDNFRYGLEIIKRHLAGDYSTLSIQRAGTLYNKGNLTTGINAYGYDLATKATSWRTRLAYATVARTLRRGVVGSDVKALQTGLAKHFPTYAGHLDLDGRFGPATEAAVQEFQRRVGLSGDGVVGPWTRGRLSEYTIYC